MILWTASEIIDATGGQCSLADWTASGVSIDTRTLKKGDVFVAISGDNFDANTFIKKAMEQGASAVVVSKSDATVDIPQVLVNNTDIALRNMGMYSRKRLHGDVIGITGSVGKTSVKDSLKSILENYGSTYATVGNLNNHYGVPLTLSRIHKDTQYAIIEMGMSAVGEIRDLTKMVRPTCAIVNTVEKAHLEFFTGIDQIGQAKAEIFEGINKGIGIYNADTNCLDILQSAIQKHSIKSFTFGTKDSCDLQLISAIQNGNGQTVKARYENTNFSFELPALGQHRASNACAVLSIISCLGIDPICASKYLNAIPPTDGRGASSTHTINDGEFLVYDESYNGAPASMHATLQVLGQTSCKGRRIAVLGDMLELGLDAQSLHRELKNSIIDNGIDLVFACGENMKYLCENLPKEKLGKWAENSEILSEYVLQSIQKNDALVIKGSAGSKMNIIAKKITGEL